MLWISLRQFDPTQRKDRWHPLIFMVASCCSMHPAKMAGPFFISNLISKWFISKVVYSALQIGSSKGGREAGPPSATLRQQKGNQPHHPPPHASLARFSRNELGRKENFSQSYGTSLKVSLCYHLASSLEDNLEGRTRKSRQTLASQTAAPGRPPPPKEKNPPPGSGILTWFPFTIVPAVGAERTPKCPPPPSGTLLNVKLSLIV